MKVDTLGNELSLLSRAGLLNLSDNSKILMEFSKNTETSNKLDSKRFSENKAGPMGFEPMTFSLEG